jgi:hypothetical protein
VAKVESIYPASVRPWVQNPGPPENLYYLQKTSAWRYSPWHYLWNTKMENDLLSK